MSEQLVETLKAANGPPVADPLVPPFSLLQSLQQFILDKLNAAPGTSYTPSFTLASGATMDGVVDMGEVTLTFAATRPDTDSAWTGSVTIQTVSATLFPGKSFTASFTDSDIDPDEFALTGTYAIDTSSFLLHGQDFRLTVGEALQFSSATIDIAYVPAGSANQTLVDATGVTVTTPSMVGAGSANLDHLILRKNGFQFAGTVTLDATAAAGSPVTFGEIFSVSRITLAATNLNVTFSGPASVTGTIALTFENISLFPAGGFFTTTVGTLTAGFDFSGFNGTDPSGSMVLTVTGFQLRVGDALNLSVPGNITIRPGQDLMVSVTDLYITSPQFGGIAAVAHDVEFRQGGFSLEDFTVGPIDPGSLLGGLAGILDIGEITLQVVGFSFANGAPLQNSLFSPDDLADFDALLAKLIAHADNVSQFLWNQFSGQTDSRTGLAPTDILTDAAVTADAKLTTLLEALNEVLRRGSSIYSPGRFAGVTLSAETQALLGEPSLTANEIIRLNRLLLEDKYTAEIIRSPSVANGFLIQGQVNLTLTGVTLFPGAGFLSRPIGTISGGYQFASADLPSPGLLTLTVNELDFDLGEALNIHLGTFTLTPSLDPIATISSVTIVSPTLAGLQSLQIEDFELTRNGFSLGTLTLGNLDSTVPVRLGDFLEFDTVALNVTGFSLDRTQTPVVSGTITATLAGLRLFPSANNVVTTVGLITATYDFDDDASLGGLSIVIADFQISVAGSLNIAANPITITPGQATIAVIGTASLAFPTLNNLTGSVSGLEITQTGFSIDTATISLDTLVLGNFLTITTPSLTFTDVEYENGGALTGQFTLKAGSASLALGTALTASITDDIADGDPDAVAGTYNLSTKRFALTLDQFDLQVSGFVGIHSDGLSLLYDPKPSGDVTMYLGATGVTVFLGSDLGGTRTGVSLVNGELGLVLYKTGAISTYALAASGEVALVGFGGVLGLSGSVQVRINTTGLAVDETVTADAEEIPVQFTLSEASFQQFFGNDLQLDILSTAGLPTLAGNFSFTRFDDSGVTKVLIGAEGINLFLGTADQSMGLRVNGAQMALLLYRDTALAQSVYALDASATVQLVGFDGLLTLAGTVGVRANTTGGEVHELIPVGGITIPLDFEADDPAGPNFSGQNLTLAIAGFASVQGDFSFTRSSVTNGTETRTEISVGATNINAFLGANEGTAEEVGVRITGARLGLLFFKTVDTALPTQTPATYALVAGGGTNELVGVTGLELATDGLMVRVNKTGTDVTDEFGQPRVISTPGGDVTLDFTSTGTVNVLSVEGHITLNVVGFVSLEGYFTFERTEDLLTHTTRILVGASGVDAFLGVHEGEADETGVRITNAKLGLVIYKKPVDPANPGAPTSFYALDASAGAELVGFGNVTLSAGNIGVRVNNTGGSVDETVLVGGEPVIISFSETEGNVQAFSGSDLTLAIAGFVSVHGSFSFQKTVTGSTTEIAVAATGVSVFLGANEGEADETGVRISGASLGLLLFKSNTTTAASTYALFAEGNVELVGVSGVQLSGSLAVKVNNTGTNVTDGGGQPRRITTPDGEVVLDFTDTNTANVQRLEGHVAFAVSGFVSLSADFAFQKTTTVTGTETRTQIDVSASDLDVFLGANEGTPNETGLRIDGASFALRVFKTVDTSLMAQPPSTYALVASGGTDTLVGVPDLTLVGSLRVLVNKTGAPVTFTNPAVTVPAGITAIQGTVTQLAIGGAINLSGSFSFTKDESVPNVTKLIIGASGIEAFLGTADGSMGLRIQNATLGMVVFKNTLTGVSTYALDASATASLIGFESILTLTGTAGVRINNTGGAVDESATLVRADGSTQEVPVHFDASEGNANGFAGSMTLTIPSITASLAGNFSFTKVIDGATNRTKLLIAASGVNGTANGGSFNLSGGTLGLVTFRNTTTNANIGYALVASAQVGVGGDGSINLSGNASARVNTANGAVNETVSAGGQNIQLIFTGNEQSFTASGVSVTIGHFVTITGSATTVNENFTDTTVVPNQTFTQKVTFTEVTLTFFIDGREFLSIGGSAVFRSGGTGGFKMISFLPTTFRILGEGLGADVNPSGKAAADVPPGAHRLGPITLGTPSVALSNFQFKPDGTLAVRITISDTLATLTTASVNATIQNISGSFDLGLKLNLADPFGAPESFTVGGFAITVGTINIHIGNFLTLSASGVVIKPEAEAGEELVAFGGNASVFGLQATLTVGGLTLGGGANNFAILGDGSFITKANFAVFFSFGPGQSAGSSFSWPSWLPIKNVSIGLSWPGDNFNANPQNFILVFSADIDSISGFSSGVTFSGGVQGVRIDVQKLLAGEFPIVGITGLSAEVSGNFFGGDVELGLTAGIIRFDALNRVIPETDDTTPVADTVFYAGLSGSLTLSGLGQISMRLGLSDFGPLSFYIEAGIPIVLDPQSGLAITNLRGGVDFGASLPDPLTMGTTAKEHAFALRSPQFAPPAQQTITQWTAQLKQQIVNLKKNVGPGNELSFADLTSQMLIRAGATLYDQYLSQNAFKADVDLTIDTSGKIFINGTATFGNSLSLKAYFYGDLSAIQGGTAKFLFLVDNPGSTPGNLFPPIFSVYGEITFQFLDASRNPILVDPDHPEEAPYFNITIDGGALLNAAGMAEVEITAHLSMTFSATSFEVEFEGALFVNKPDLGQLASVNGQLTIQRTESNDVEVWGFVYGSVNLNKLEAQGIHAQGDALLQINTTNRSIPIVLKRLVSPGVIEETPATLEPRMFSIQIGGDVAFSIDGTRVFSVVGGVELRIDASKLIVFVSADLEIGPEGAPLMTFSALGLVQVMYDDSGLTGFAASLRLSRSGALAGVPDTGFSVTLLLEINLTGEAITYNIPPLLQPYVGNTPVTIPAGPRQFDGVTIGPAGAYIVVQGTGTLRLLNSFNLVGGFRLEISGDNVTMQLAARISIDPLGQLNVSGSITVGSIGLVGALSVTLDASAGAFSFSGKLQIEINTSGSAQMVPRFTVSSSGQVTGTENVSIPERSFRLFIGGSLNVFNVVTIEGSFELNIQPTVTSVAVNGRINLFGIQLTVNGCGAVYGGSNPGVVLSLTIHVGTGLQTDLFKLEGTFSLLLSTRNISTTNIPGCPGLTIAARYAKISIDGTLRILGFALQGSMTITLQGSYFRIDIADLSFSFFGLFTLHAHGWLDSNANFDLTASIHWELGDCDIICVEGTLTVRIFSYVDPATQRRRAGFSGHFYGSLQIIGYSVGSIEASLYVENSYVKIYIRGCIDLWVDEVCKSLTFEFGRLEDPPPPPTLATLTSGVLRLNMGVDAGVRTVAVGTVDEAYSVTYVSGSPGNETLRVTAFGYNELFTGVSKVLANNVLGGTDSVDIGGGVAALVELHGGTGSFTVVLGGTGSAQVFGGSSSKLTVFAGTGFNAVNGQSAALTYVAVNPSGTHSITTGTGENRISVPSLAAAGNATVNAAAGTANYIYVGFGLPATALSGVPPATNSGRLDNIQGALTINGSAATVAYLDDTGSPAARTGTLSKTALTGFGMGASGITYGGLGTLNLTLVNWGNTLNVTGASATNTNLKLGSGTNLLNIGNKLDDLLGNLNITGSGKDAMTVNDTASTSGKNGTLTATTLTGFGMGGTVTFTGIKTLAITLNGLGNTLTIVSTNVGTPVTVNTGAGNDTVNVRTTDSSVILNLGAGVDVVIVGSLAPVSGGVLNGITSALTVNGSGNDTLNVDDSGSATNKTGELTSTTLAGLGMGSRIGGPLPVVITFSGLLALDISLGSGADVFTIQSTISGTTSLDVGPGNDVVYVKSAAGLTSVNGGLGDDTFYVGTSAPGANSVLGQILAVLTLDGDAGADTAYVDDRGHSGPSIGTLTGSSLTGLEMAGINYGGLETLNIELGAGDDVFNVQGTSAVTNLNANNGNDRFYVSSLANVNQATKLSTDFLAGTLDGLLGALNINAGAGRHLLMVSDHSSAAANGTAGGHATLTSAQIRGLSVGDINYLSAPAGNFADGITVWSGSGADFIDVTSTHERAGFRTITTLNTGLGNDTVNVTLLAGVDGFFVLNTQGPDQDGLPNPPSDDDFVNGAGSTLPLFVFGGVGHDQIITGSGNDFVFGDRGLVEFRDANGALLAVLGHGGPGDFTDGLAHLVTAAFTRTESLGGNDTMVLNDGADAAFGGLGDDTMGGGAGADALLGDNGVVTFDSSGLIIDLNVSSPTLGGNDAITAGAGNDLLIGGGGADTLFGGNGSAAAVGATVSDRDLILGDNGRIQLALGTLVLMRTSDVTVGGDDTIEGNEDSDIIFGGAGADNIAGSSGSAVAVTSQFGDADLILGDNGRVDVAAGAVTLLRTTDYGTGGADVIEGNEDADVILGGDGADIIHGDAGSDLVLGDQGTIEFAVPEAAPDTVSSVFVIGAPATAEVAAPTVGGGDTLLGGNENDVLIGGTGDDVISAGSGSDVIFGDHARVTFSAGALASYISILTGNGTGAGNDTVHGDEGDDFIIGQQGDDLLYGDAGDDDIWGGHNLSGGVDGSDRIDGGSGDDVILGDNGAISRRNDAVTPRSRVLVGPVIYTETGDAAVTATPQAMPSGAAARNILLINESVAAGNDVIAGGAGDDMIFGQLGNDTLRGDGRIDPTLSGAASAVKYADNAGDGDDYIEGNTGDDSIYGDLGQDDLIGGSSDLFGLAASAQRADGSDTIFGGDGTDILRNTMGDTSANGHARDADVILGDNGRIFRLIGINGAVTGQFLVFAYDNSPGATGRIIPRAISLLEYTTGAKGRKDIGAADVIHGEGGDDLIHGMVGNDVIYGEGQDDSLIGGTGDDWISAGSGDDGLIGDDGRILTSRNGVAELLYGITATTQTVINNGADLSVTLNTTGRISKAALLYNSLKGGRDFLFGGLGNDFLHGGAGDDGISGGEAMEDIYNQPSEAARRMFTPGVLKYNKLNPLARIERHPLNFEAFDNLGRPIDDGQDALFGENGNDWLVGGTGADHMFGGAGRDTLNTDDNLGTLGGANTAYDGSPFDAQDIAFGGTGRDTLSANSLRDRLFDLVGEFGGYLTPTNPSGAPSTTAITRPGAGVFLRQLMQSEGLNPLLTEILTSGLSSTRRQFWQVGPH